MHLSDVPGECARLRERISTLITQKGSHVDMPHVVVDQRCALREYLFTSGAIWFAEQALEELLLGLHRARDRGAVDLPIGVAWYAFEACIVFSACD